jgi:dihydrolipoamide dehydrogenase
MTTRITILGAGSGGYTAAIRAAHLGAEVTVIENDNLGGTCLNWGCIPTKTLRASAEALVTARRLSTFGIATEGGFRPDMQAIMARKDKVVKTLVGAIAALFKKNRIRLINGRGTVLSPSRVKVETHDNDEIEVEGDKLILATGSKVMDLPVLPFDGHAVISSDEALQLEEIPEEILVVGGGVVGVEFAFILDALGSKVTVVEALDRILPLPSIDGDISRILQREMKKRKITFFVNKTVADTQKTEDGKIKVMLGPSPFLSEVGEKDRKAVDLSVDKVLVCIGRGYNTTGIGLGSVGVERDAGGWIPVNDRLETNISEIYAIGDVLGPDKIMLAHVASTEAFVAAENCLGAGRVMDYRVVPSGIFTFPEIGSVGLSEEQAESQGLNYRTDSFDFRGLGKSQAMGELDGQAKIISNPENGQILGVHIIGPHATDLVAEATLALKLRATAGDLAETIHLHPSLSEVLMEAAHAATGRSLHILR